VTQTFTYDNTDQVTGDGTSTLTYDGTGNRTNGGNATGAGNQLTYDGTWTYSYDLEGNLSDKTQGSNAVLWHYGYDSHNRMTLAQEWSTDADGNADTLQKEVDYGYDVWGNRVEQAVDSDGDSVVDSVQRYAYDGWKVKQDGQGQRQRFVGQENWDVW